MKKLLSIICFVLFSLKGYCDTLDYYHIFINDSIIGQYNSRSAVDTIIIQSEKFKKSDRLIIRYAKDHPCVKCIYGIKVFCEIKEELPQSETKENFAKLSISLNRLKNLRDKYGLESFKLYYYTRGLEGLNQITTSLFVLKLE
tara:strand:- start:718 stop:1146 length:429 start_codon:yes stop_codon:yes gene_type:complete